MILLPPPHPRIASLIAYEYLEVMRNEIIQLQCSIDPKVTVVNLDQLFFQKIDENFELVRNIDGIKYINVKLFRSAFEMGLRNVVLVNRTVMKQCCDLIRQALASLKPKELLVNNIRQIEKTTEKASEITDTPESLPKESQIEIKTMALKLKTQISDSETQALIDTGTTICCVNDQLIDVLVKY